MGYMKRRGESVQEFEERKAAGLAKRREKAATREREAQQREAKEAKKTREEKKEKRANNVASDETVHAFMKAIADAPSEESSSSEEEKDEPEAPPTARKVRKPDRKSTRLNSSHH